MTSPSTGNPLTPRLGGTLSADIAVPGHDQVVKFYAQVLTTGDRPFWREDLMNSQGMPIIGLGARTEEHDDLPLQWMPHIQVADIAASVRASVERGGKALMYGKDDDGNAQWAVLKDPNGATFGIIPIVPAETIPVIEAGDLPGLGHIAWLDLTVEDAEATQAFYQDVVGWSVEAVDMHEGDQRYVDYSMLGGDGAPAAGICHARGTNKGLPSCWMLYLPVGDLSESVHRVRELGGQVLRAPGQDDGAPIAVIQDPAGATIALADRYPPG